MTVRRTLGRILRVYSHGLTIQNLFDGSLFSSNLREVNLLKRSDFRQYFPSQSLNEIRNLCQDLSKRPRQHGNLLVSTTQKCSNPYENALGEQVFQETNH